MLARNNTFVNKKGPESPFCVPFEQSLIKRMTNWIRRFRRHNRPHCRSWMQYLSILYIRTSS